MPLHLSSTLQKRSKPPTQANFCKELAKPTHRKTENRKKKLYEERKPAENNVYTQWRISA